eukprot:CAMPEP_0178788780 /NCGR_PEP_ID=MMETSP0745-20121128/6561_1 /TAXON_ID=913974 /ORGANISM="Nitzschia punctata, Strain CCMP561" /LENGTH=279 /DNA_ID=CAMNT_0020446701 /DNA_START=188 /DNA_END=1027 /DNA_ORIENTATION=+
MRSFFDHYATLCPSKSYATLTSCTSIEPSSLNTSIWKPCVLKYDRKDGERHNLKQTPVPKENLHSYDMIGGHFRIGLMDHLDDTGSVNPRNRHLVFVRNAAMKYISGKVYIRTKAQRNLTSYDIICEIEEEIKGMIQSQEHHMKYTNYLLTPTQARQRQKESWSYQQRAQVVMQNLIDYNCTIGVVEDMKGSIEMLREVLDPSRQASDLFEAYSGDAPTKSNVSPLSSKSILETLQQELPETYENLTEFVKYEQQITDFAVTLHNLQRQLQKDMMADKR